jgi:hypothetical protein
VNSTTATGGRAGAIVVRGLRWSRPGGIERAGIVNVTLAGATCLRANGDGMGARRAGSTLVPACVERAGVEALARVTGVLVRVGLAFAERFDFAVLLRAMVRALPLTFRCDAAAFNCFPLFGLWPRRTWATKGLSVAPPYDNSF